MYSHSPGDPLASNTSLQSALVASREAHQREVLAEECWSLMSRHRRRRILRIVAFHPAEIPRQWNQAIESAPGPKQIMSSLTSGTRLGISGAPEWSLTPCPWPDPYVTRCIL